MPHRILTVFLFIFALFLFSASGWAQSPAAVSCADQFTISVPTGNNSAVAMAMANQLIAPPAQSGLAVQSSSTTYTGAADAIGTFKDSTYPANAQGLNPGCIGATSTNSDGTPNGLGSGIVLSTGSILNAGPLVATNNQPLPTTYALPNVDPYDGTPACSDTSPNGPYDTFTPDQLISTIHPLRSSNGNCVYGLPFSPMGYLNPSAGDPILNSLIGDTTYDASVLQVNFAPTNDAINSGKTWIQMTYVFSSDEYPLFVGQPFNDVFAFVFNGQNIALLPNQQIPVSINSVNAGKNSQYFIDNYGNGPGDPVYGRINTQMNGMTVVMKALAPMDLTRSSQTIRVSVGDVYDGIGDTNVFIQQFSLMAVKAPVCSPANPSGPGTPDDMDCDGVIDIQDNCPGVYNPNQQFTPALGITAGDACRSGMTIPTPPPVDFSELDGQGCVAGPWQASTQPASFNFTITPQQSTFSSAPWPGAPSGTGPANYQMNVVLSYQDNGGNTPYSISINAATPGYVPDDTLYGVGVDLLVPCTVTQSGVSDSTAKCMLTAIDNQDGQPTLNMSNPPDRFRITVESGSFAGYTSGSLLNLVSCGSKKTTSDIMAYIPPVASDDAANAGIGVLTSINVISNDGSLQNLPLTVEGVAASTAGPFGSSVTTGIGGTASVSQQRGYVEYISPTSSTTFVSGSHPTDSFAYEVIDTKGGTSVASVTVSINRPPLTPNFSVTAKPNTPTLITLPGVDPDGDTLTFTVTNPGHGKVVAAAGNVIQYTSSNNFSGTDSFSYSATDALGGTSTGTVTITVGSAAKPVPTITVTGGSFTYSGSPYAATATATGSNNVSVSGTFSISYNGGTSVPVNVGIYTVVAVFTSSDPNYTNGVGTGLITIIPSAATAVTSGRMTGGGSIISSGLQVTHGMELQCSVNAKQPSHLEVNWGAVNANGKSHGVKAHAIAKDSGDHDSDKDDDHGTGQSQSPGRNNFKLTGLTDVLCFDDPSLNPGQPAAGFDTITGSGTGYFNGKPATIQFTFTDTGEPGTNDTASMTILSSGTTVLQVSGKLTNGNQQAHKN